MAFELEVEYATVTTSYTRNRVNLEFDVDTGSVAELLTISDVIDNFNVSDLLEEIGVDRVKQHFNLVDAE